MDRRIAALDGLRGIAIFLVLLRHLFGTPGTWAGVDIFFVLSGYLITSILRSERDETHFWKIFYVRRATRILPAYIALIVGTVVLMRLPWHILWPYYTFFGANVASIVLTDAMMGPLTPLWSLAVEEHFYFLWPINVRRFTDRTLAWILLGIIVAEPVVRILFLQVTTDWKVFYFLTPFHLDGLAMGSLLSIVLASERGRATLDRALPWLLPVAAVVSAAFFGSSGMSRERVWLFNSIGYSLLAVTSVLVVGWLVLRQKSLLSRALSIKPLTFLGRVSYSLYLYHLLVMFVAEVVLEHFGFHHRVRNNAAGLPFAIFFAWLSFRYFESPFLAYGRRVVARYRAEERRAVVVA